MTIKDGRTKHGMHKSPEHGAWTDMKGRCLNIKNKRYKDYGGRGITIYTPWLKFENFFADMGARPGKGYSLDRIDNNGNYEPGNCRWATWAVQFANRRTSKLNENKVREIRRLAANGMNNTAIGKLFGVSQPTISNIVNGNYWKHVS